MRAAMLADHEERSEEAKLEQLAHRNDTHAVAKRKEAEMAKIATAFGIKNTARPPFQWCRSDCLPVGGSLLASPLLASNATRDGCTVGGGRGI